LGCLKKSPNDLLSWEVLSLTTVAVEPRKGLLAANGFALVELNALNGLLLPWDVSRLVGLVLNNVLVLVLIGKSELDVLVPNKGFATELLLLEDANNGFICEFLFELG